MTDTEAAEIARLQAENGYLRMGLIAAGINLETSASVMRSLGADKDADAMQRMADQVARHLRPDT